MLGAGRAHQTAKRAGGGGGGIARFTDWLRSVYGIRNSKVKVKASLLTQIKTHTERSRQTEWHGRQTDRALCASTVFE